jgi:hypothetical protein
MMWAVYGPVFIAWVYGIGGLVSRIARHIRASRTATGASGTDNHPLA